MSSSLGVSDLQTKPFLCFKTQVPKTKSAPYVWESSGSKTIKASEDLHFNPKNVPTKNGAARCSHCSSYCYPRSHFHNFTRIVGSPRSWFCKCRKCPQTPPADIGDAIWYDIILNSSPIVPARGGAEVALDLITIFFFIYRTCVRRAPGARVLCELVGLLFGPGDRALINESYNNFFMTRMKQVTQQPIRSNTIILHLRRLLKRSGLYLDFLN